MRFDVAFQVERDLMIWNSMKYQPKPVMIKSNEDKLLVKHRRWYSQFYSEHNRRLHAPKKKQTKDPVL